MKKISERFYNQDQSWYYERIVTDGLRRFRVLIRRNAYDGQSYLRGYVLGQLQWNLLVDRPIEGAKCFAASYVKKNEQMTPFAFDAESVLKELKEIAG